MTTQQAPTSTTERRVAILGFHKIGDPPPDGWESWFYVSEPVFTRFLTELCEDGWEALSLDRFLHGLDAPETLPARSVLITFDDGYRSMREVMLPCLERFGMPAVLFVPTDFVGGRNTFDRGMEPDEPICDWNDLRRLAAGGVAIQSHAASHRRFSELSAAQRLRELLDSKRILEENLGSRVETIAFPYGDPGPGDERSPLVDAGYRAAFLYGGRPMRVPCPDPLRIERLAMGPDTDLRAELAERP